MGTRDDFNATLKQARQGQVIDTSTDLPPEPLLSVPRSQWSKATPTCKEAVRFLCRVAQLLLVKNERYGDSAAKPARVFSKVDPAEQLLVRIDDKLSRIQSSGYELATDEDTVADLVGYLALLRGVEGLGVSSPDR